MADTEHNALDDRLRGHIAHQRELLAEEEKELRKLQLQVHDKVEHVMRLRRSISELTGIDPKDVSYRLSHYPRKSTIAKVLAAFDDSEAVTYKTIEERSGLSHAAAARAVALLCSQGRVGIRGREDRQLTFEKV